LTAPTAEAAPVAPCRTAPDAALAPATVEVDPRTALAVAEPVAAAVAVPVMVEAPPTPRHVIDERHAALLRHGVPDPGDTEEPAAVVDDTADDVAEPGTITVAVADVDEAAALLAVVIATFSAEPDADDAPAEVARAITRARAVADDDPADAATPATSCNPVAEVEPTPAAVAT
jgi:hypothetical protein